MAYTRKDYLGSRAETTLNGSLSAGATSITITSATGWPTIANGGHYAVIDPDTTSEEKVLVTARTTTTLTVTRGVDGTTGVSHASGATIRPSISAVDFDEANYMVAQTVGKATTAGQLLKASAANTFAALDKGSNSTILAVDSGGTLGYTTVTNAMVNSSAGIALSKLQQIGTGYVLGNSSGSTAAPSTITIPTWTTVRKSSDTTRTSTSEGAVDPHLTGAVTVGVQYEYEIVIVYATAALFVNLYYANVDGTTSGDRNVSHDWSSTLLIDDSSVNTLYTFSSYAAAGTAGGGKRVAYARGVSNPTQASFGLHWGPGSSGGSTTIYAGSYLRYRPLT